MLRLAYLELLPVDDAVAVGVKHAKRVLQVDPVLEQHARDLLDHAVLPVPAGLTGGCNVQ